MERSSRIACAQSFEPAIAIGTYAGDQLLYKQLHDEENHAGGRLEMDSPSKAPKRGKDKVAQGGILKRCYSDRLTPVPG